MVQPTGLEPVTSSFAGRRSNPTELRLHMDVGIVFIFFKMQVLLNISLHFIYFVRHFLLEQSDEPPGICSGKTLWFSCIQHSSKSLSKRRWRVSLRIHIWLITSWHSIEIKSLEIYHGFCDIVFLLSFLEKSTFIEDSLFDQRVDVLCWEFFLWKGFFVLHIASTLLVWEIESRLFVLISSIDKSGFFLSLWKFSSSCLFFYESWWESVTVSHSF